MKKLLIGVLVLSASSAFSGEITVTGLPSVKTKIKSSIYVPAGVTTDLNREQHENRKAAIIKLKSYIEVELGRKVVGDGECKRIDFHASYPAAGGREGWTLDECSVSFL